MNILDAQKKRIMTSEVKLPEVQVSNRYKGLNVLGLVADTSACGYYRVINPLHMLKMHGANVNYGSHHSMENFLRYDYIVAPRQHSPDVYEILRFVAWENKTIMFEIDDDLHAVLPSSPAFIAYHQGSPELNMVTKMMSICHGITTTTPEIARWYYQYNRNVAILENYIDLGFRDWGADVTYEGGYAVLKPKYIERPVEWEGKVVFGWQGGTTHQEDIKILGPQVRQILEDNSNAIFAMYASPQMAEEMVRTYNIPDDRVTLIPARHFLDHPSGLHGVDIALAPIMCCQFNLAKSHLKCLEGMAVGSAMIASNVGPYARFDKRHPGAIMTVGKGPNCRASFADAVTELIKNPDKLKEMQIKGRQLIYDEYSLERNFGKWPASWKTIHERKLQGEVGPPDVLSKDINYRSYGTCGRNDPCPCGSGLKYKACCVEAWG